MTGIRKLTLILITLISLALPPVLLAQTPSPTEAMLAANRLYEAGQFAEAAAAYRRLLDSGLQNSAVYYNLGNAAFKQGDLGQAILNYRRAERLSPRDPDIRANLALVRAQTADNIPAGNKAFLSELVTLSQRWLTLNELAALALGLWFAAALASLAAGRLRPGRWRAAAKYSLLAASLLLAVSAASLGSRLYAEASRPAGIIVAPAVNVASGPGSQYITEFTLHSGAEVDLIEQRDYWVRLTLPGGQLQGWVPAETVAQIKTN